MRASVLRAFRVLRHARSMLPIRSENYPTMQPIMRMRGFAEVDTVGASGCEEGELLGALLAPVPASVVRVVANRRRPAGEYVDRLLWRDAAAVGQGDGERVRLRVQQFAVRRHQDGGAAARAAAERGARSAQGGCPASRSRVTAGHIITVVPGSDVRPCWRGCQT